MRRVLAALLVVALAAGATPVALQHLEDGDDQRTPHASAGGADASGASGDPWDIGVAAPGTGGDAAARGAPTTDPRVRALLRSIVEPYAATPATPMDVLVQVLGAPPTDLPPIDLDVPLVDALAHHPMLPRLDGPVTLLPDTERALSGIVQAHGAMIQAILEAEAGADPDRVLWAQARLATLAWQAAPAIRGDAALPRDVRLDVPLEGTSLPPQDLQAAVDSLYAHVGLPHVQVGTAMAGSSAAGAVVASLDRALMTHYRTVGELPARLRAVADAVAGARLATDDGTLDADDESAIEAVDDAIEDLIGSEAARLRAVMDLVETVRESAPLLPSPSERFPFIDPLGLVTVLGPGDDTLDFSGEPNVVPVSGIGDVRVLGPTRSFLVIDLGGDDHYTGPIAVAGLLNGTASVDFFGNQPTDEEGLRPFTAATPAADLLRELGRMVGEADTGPATPFTNLTDEFVNGFLLGFTTIVDTLTIHPRAGTPLSVLVELGGNDTYESNRGIGLSNVAGLSAVVDLSGDDTYTTGKGLAMTMGFGAASLVLDRAGDDSYAADQGLGYETWSDDWHNDFFSFVVLDAVFIDAKGDDTYALQTAGGGATDQGDFFQDELFMGILFGGHPQIVPGCQATPYPRAMAFDLAGGAKDFGPKVGGASIKPQLLGGGGAEPGAVASATVWALNRSLAAHVESAGPDAADDTRLSIVASSLGAACGLLSVTAALPDGQPFLTLDREGDEAYAPPYPIVLIDATGDDTYRDAATPVRLGRVPLLLPRIVLETQGGPPLSIEDPGAGAADRDDQGSRSAIATIIDAAGDDSYDGDAAGVATINDAVLALLSRTAPARDARRLVTLPVLVDAAGDDSYSSALPGGIAASYASRPWSAMKGPQAGAPLFNVGNVEPGFGTVVPLVSVLFDAAGHDVYDAPAGGSLGAVLMGAVTGNATIEPERDAFVPYQAALFLDASEGANVTRVRPDCSRPGPWDCVATGDLSFGAVRVDPRVDSPDGKPRRYLGPMPNIARSLSPGSVGIQTGHNNQATLPLTAIGVAAMSGGTTHSVATGNMSAGSITLDRGADRVLAVALTGAGTDALTADERDAVGSSRTSVKAREDLGLEEKGQRALTSTVTNDVQLQAQKARVALGLYVDPAGPDAYGLGNATGPAPPWANDAAWSRIRGDRVDETVTPAGQAALNATLDEAAVRLVRGHPVGLGLDDLRSALTALVVGALPVDDALATGDVVRRITLRCDGSECPRQAGDRLGLTWDTAFEVRVTATLPAGVRADALPCSDITPTDIGHAHTPLRPRADDSPGCYAAVLITIDDERMEQRASCARDAGTPCLRHGPWHLDDRLDEQLDAVRPSALVWSALTCEASVRELDEAPRVVDCVSHRMRLPYTVGHPTRRDRGLAVPEGAYHATVEVVDAVSVALGSTHPATRELGLDVVLDPLAYLESVMGAGEADARLAETAGHFAVRYAGNSTAGSRTLVVESPVDLGAHVGAGTEVCLQDGTDWWTTERPGRSWFDLDRGLWVWAAPLSTIRSDAPPVDPPVAWLGRLRPDTEDCHESLPLRAPIPVELGFPDDSAPPTLGYVPTDALGLEAAIGVHHVGAFYDVGFGGSLRTPQLRTDTTDERCRGEDEVDAVVLCLSIPVRATDRSPIVSMLLDGRPDEDAFTATPGHTACALDPDLPPACAVIQVDNGSLACSITATDTAPCVLTFERVAGGRRPDGTWDRVALVNLTLYGRPADPQTLGVIAAIEATMGTKPDERPQVIVQLPQIETADEGGLLSSRGDSLPVDLASPRDRLAFQGAPGAVLLTTNTTAVPLRWRQSFEADAAFIELQARPITGGEWTQLARYDVRELGDGDEMVLAPGIPAPDGGEGTIALRSLVTDTSGNVERVKRLFEDPVTLERTPQLLPTAGIDQVDLILAVDTRTPDATAGTVAATRYAAELLVDADEDVRVLRVALDGKRWPADFRQAPATQHRILLPGLEPGHTYAAVVEIVDLAGNHAVLSAEVATLHSLLARLESPAPGTAVGDALAIRWSSGVFPASSGGRPVVQLEARLQRDGATCASVRHSYVEDAPVEKTSGRELALSTAECSAGAGHLLLSFTNSEETATFDVPVLLDRAPPVPDVRITGAVGRHGWFVGPVEVAANATDDVRVASQTLVVRRAGGIVEATRLTSSGRYQLAVAATDAVGRSAAAVFPLLLDLEPPVVRAGVARHGLLQVLINDAGSGPGDVRARWSGDDWSPWFPADAVTLVPLPRDGTGTIEVEARDAAGHVTPARLDPKAATTITVTDATVRPAGAGALELRLRTSAPVTPFVLVQRGGAPVTEFLGGAAASEHTMSLAPLPPGAGVTLAVHAVDPTAGLRLLATLSAVVPSDSEPPAPPTALRAEALATGRVRVQWDPATDNVAIAHYVLTRTDPTGPTTRTVADTVLLDDPAPGATTYSVRAVDLAGLESAASETLAFDAPATVRVVGVQVDPLTGAAEAPFTFTVALSGVGATGAVLHAAGGEYAMTPAPAVGGVTVFSRNVTLPVTLLAQEDPGVWYEILTPDGRIRYPPEGTLPGPVVSAGLGVTEGGGQTVPGPPALLLVFVALVASGLARRRWRR